MECDPILPRHLGGSDRYTNLQLLHRPCHDQKTVRWEALLADQLATVSMTTTV
jgi:5-methylcytosine-specific restriction endonuclease McrA